MIGQTFGPWRVIKVFHGKPWPWALVKHRNGTVARISVHSLHWLLDPVNA